MVLDYPDAQLYILFAVSITFFGGVVLSEKLNLSWLHLLVSYSFVLSSWASIVFVFAEQCLVREEYLKIETWLSWDSDVSWETRLHSLALLLFAISFLFVFPIGKKRAEPVFLVVDEAE